MKNALLSVMMVFGILICSGTAMAAIQEGEWSMTTVVKVGGEEAAQAMKEMENMSPEDKAMMQQMMGGNMNMGAMMGGAGISSTIKQCLTNENPVPQANEEDCQTTHTMNGNTLHFESVCPSGRSTGDVTYNNNSMTGTIKSTQTEKGQTHDVTIDISGEYVGPCNS